MHTFRGAIQVCFGGFRAVDFLVCYVVFYDLADGVCEYRELVLVENDRKVKRTGACHFYKSYAHGNSVYLFGYEYPAILKIDVDTRETVYLTDWVIEVEKRISRMSASMGYVSDFVIVDNSLWALCECANAVLRLDLHKDKIEVMDISSDLDIQCGICFDGNFWVAFVVFKQNIWQNAIGKRIVGNDGKRPLQFFGVCAYK